MGGVARQVLIGLSVLALVAGCEPPAASEPRGWLRFWSTPSIRSPEYSIAAPLRWQRIPNDDPGTMFLSGPEPEQDILSLHRFRVEAGGDDWLAELPPHVPLLGLEDVASEWVDLPGGRAHHVAGGPFGSEVYLFRAPDEGAAIVLSFADLDFVQDSDDPARNRAMAETFRFESDE